MRRIRIGRGWRWGLALGLVLLLVAGGLFYRSSLEQVALDAAAGAPATTRYPAPGDTVTSGTRRTRAPGRNRGRRNPSNTRGADGPAVRTIPAAPGGRADAAKVIVGLGDSVPAGPRIGRPGRSKLWTRSSACWCVKPSTADWCLRRTDPTCL